jgi:hypothetical protein
MASWESAEDKAEKAKPVNRVLATYDFEWFT